MANEQIPAGWYPDPAGDVTKIRYWDGQGWTDQTQDAQPVGAQSNYNVPIAPQPIYAQGQQAPMYGTMPDGTKDRKGFAIAGMVLGIVSIPCGCLAYFAFLPGLLGVIFGALGIKSSGKGMAIVGIVLGAIGILFGIGMTILGLDILENPQNYGLPSDFYDDLFSS